MKIDISTDEAISMELEPLPAGWYKMIATASEVKATKAGTGTYVKYEFLLVSGQYEGRKHWEMYTLTNPNPKAVEIGRGQLATFAGACGKSGHVDDSEDLHDLPFMGKLSIEPGSGSYGPKNKLVAYENDPLLKKTGGKKTVVSTTIDNDPLPPWK